MAAAMSSVRQAHKRALVDAKIDGLEGLTVFEKNLQALMTRMAGWLLSILIMLQRECDVVMKGICHFGGYSVLSFF